MTVAIRVLYVDDEPDLLTIGKLYLEQSGDFAVTTSMSATEGIRLLEQKTFDAIISDYQMPGMDGIQFLGEVRTLFGQIPFILFTGRGREDVVIQAINSGADFYLQKGGDPVAQFVELAHKVRQSVGKYKAEKQIKLSEEKFSAAFAISPDPVAITDVKYGGIISANPAFAAWSGYSSDELIGKSTKDLNLWYNPHDRNEIIASLQAHENVIDKSIKFRIKTGDIRDCRFSAQFISIDGEEYLFTRSHDVTDIMRANLALQQSEERFRAIFANQRNGTLIIDPSDHRIVDANPYLCSLVGLPKDQIVGKVCHRFVCPAESGKCPITDLGQRVDNSERVLIAADGRKIPIIKTVVNAKFLDKEYLIETIHDITEHKRSEKALLENENRLNSIIRVAPIGIGVTLNRIILQVNERLCKMTGYSPDELIGKSGRLLYPSDEEYDYVGKDKYAQIARTGTGSVETKWQKKDGTIIDVLLSSTPINPSDLSMGVTFTAVDITDRKRAEEALQESEVRFRLSFELANIGMSLTGIDGTFILVNHALCEMLGYSAEELQTKSFVDITHPDDLAASAECVGTLLDGERPVYRLEKRYIRKDGTIVWVDLSTMLLRDPSGKPLRFVTHIMDITERKRTEEALRESEEKYRNIFAAENDALLLVDDKTGFILEANNSACRLFGYSPEEFARLRNINLSAEPEKTKQAMKEAKTWIPIRYHKKKDGTIFPVEISISWFVLNNRYLHIVAIHDITERKRAEEKLKVSEEKYRTYIENSPEGIFIVNAEGNYLDVNPSACSMLGYTREEFLSLTISDLVPPDYLTSSLSRFSKLKETGLLMSESVLVKKNGDLLPVFLNAVQLPDGKYLGFCSDITKRRTIEAALHESEAFLREVITGANEGIIVYNRELRITLWNPFMEEMTGLKAEYVQGKLAVDVFPFIRENGIENLLKQALSGVISESADFEYIIGSTGKKGWVKGIYSPHYDSDHTIAGVIGIVQKVTERKRMEEVLKQSEQKYRTLFEGALNPILIADEEGRYVDANEAALQFLETEKEELVRKTVWDYSPQRLIEEQKHEHDAFTEPRTLETVYSVHGKEKTLILNVLPVDMLGKRYVIGIGQDITERKQAEEALRESEEKFRLITDTIDEAFWMADVEIGKIFYVSPSFERIWGLSRESLYKNPRTFLDAVHKDDRERVLADLEIEKTGQPFDHEYRIVLPDGNIRNIWDRGFPIRDEKGQISIYAGTAIDITERKRAEGALRNSELKYRSLIESSSDAIFCVDQNGEYKFTNLVFASTFDKTPDYFIGKTFWDIYPKEHADYRQLTNLALFETGVTQTIEVEVPLPEKTLYFIAKANPIKDENGKVILNLTHATDITERKRAEGALREANKKLNLLSSITRHDINNQLTVLMGYLTILEKKQTDPTLNNYLGKASTAAQQISSMIQFTKEYEKIGVNAPAWQDSRTLVDTASKQTTLGNVVVKNDLPAGTEVFADPLVVTVFYNLMDNAARYGGKITTIRFSAEERDGNHVVLCEDDGDGIPAEEKEKIFEHGFGKNTGLGLALSREILSITGITIRETGEPSKGARFEMTVPKGAWRFGGAQ